MTKTCGNCIHFDYYLLSVREDEGQITLEKDPDLGHCLAAAPFWAQSCQPLVMEKEESAKDCGCYKMVTE